MSDIEVLKELKQELRALSGYSQKEDDVSNWIDAINNLIEENKNARKEGAIEQKEKDKIDFIRLEVMPKSKKKQYRVFFKDGTEQVFELEGVKEQ